jgi:hypothetical protein
MATSLATAASIAWMGAACAAFGSALSARTSERQEQSLAGEAAA